jgi:competence protein ComEC
LALRVPARKVATLAGVLVAGAYTLLAGFAVPTQRTFYMLAVIAIALWSGRVVSISLLLCWALLAVILLDPWAVLAPGFWLSFGAVALLVYAGAGRIAERHWLREAVHTQWVVTLGLTPMLLALFQQVSVVSSLANAFAIPLISLLVTPLTLLGAVFPLDIILLAAHAVMAGCMALLEACARLPMAVWQQHAPPAWTVLLAKSGVAWMLLPRGFPLRWLGVAALAPMFLLLPVPLLPGELRVAVLDVGQGLAVVVQTARHALLYDTGPRYSEEADSGNRIILPYLRGAGISRLDGLVVSHDDNDHLCRASMGLGRGALRGAAPRAGQLRDQEAERQQPQLRAQDQQPLRQPAVAGRHRACCRGRAAGAGSGKAGCRSAGGSAPRQQDFFDAGFCRQRQSKNHGIYRRLPQPLRPS